MLHGGGPSSVASFDLPVRKGSFAQEFVQKDIKVYLMDIRGWGGSTDPEYDPTSNPINVPVSEAADDIGLVVDWILQKEDCEKLAFFGWATGGHWGGFYASRHPTISHFISLNSLYGAKAKWGLSTFFALKDTPSVFDPNLRGWRISEEKGLTGSWERSIPLKNKQEWRDSTLANNYKKIAVETDCSFPSNIRKMKVPAGYREESFQMAKGVTYWNAADISSKCLVIRGQLDFWSRPIDLAAFKRDNQKTDTLTIQNGTHYLFLDRASRGRDQLISHMLDFLSQ